ncbi:hypothetical protein ACLMJK_009066 [Lecanora helva]
MKFILWHLQIVRQDADDMLLKPSEKDKVIENLVMLLQDPDRIEQHLDEEFFGGWFWFDRPVNLVALQAWLCDDDTRHLDRKIIKQGWLRRATSGPKVLAFQDIAVMVARNWLGGRKWPAGLPFQWIETFLTRLGEDQVRLKPTEAAYGDSSIVKSLNLDVDPNNKCGASGTKEGSSSIEATPCEPSSDAVRMETTEPTDADPPPVHTRVMRATAWVQRETVIVTNSLYYERLGATYLYFEENQLAEEAFLKAKILPDCSWQNSRDLAKTYANRGAKDLAVKKMETVFAQLRGREDLSAADREDLAYNLIEASRWQTALGNTDDAIGNLRKANEIEQSVESYSELFTLYLETNRKSEILKFFDELGKDVVKDENLTKFGTMLLKFAESF